MQLCICFAKLHKNEVDCILEDGEIRALEKEDILACLNFAKLYLIKVNLGNISNQNLMNILEKNIAQILHNDKQFL